MTSLPITPPTARAGTATKSAAPPPGGASGDFAALLTQTTARTAPAEGPKTRPQDSRRRDEPAPRAAKDEAAAPRADAPTPTTAPAPADAPVTPAAQQPAPADAQQQQPAMPVAADAPAPAVPLGDVPVTPPADAAAITAQAAVAVAAIALPTTTVPATATPQAGVPTPAVPGAPADPQALALLAAGAPPADPAAAPAADGTAPGQLAIPAELLDAKAGAHAGGEGKAFNKDGAPQRDLPPAPTLPPADATATPTPTPTSTPTPLADAAPVAPGAPAPVPAIAQAQPTATAQTAGWAGTGSAGAPQLTRGSVVQAAERVQELVRIATTRSGNARATLQLKPEALGQVDVHLRTSREGLVATIAAHDQAGLDALQQAGGELRRLLEDRGVQLHSLDLQLSAGSEGFSHQRDARQAESGRGGAAVSYDLADDEDVVAEDELILTTAPSTSSSSLVDVTA